MIERIKCKLFIFLLKIITAKNTNPDFVSSQAQLFVSYKLQSIGPYTPGMRPSTCVLVLKHLSTNLTVLVFHDQIT